MKRFTVAALVGLTIAASLPTSASARLGVWPPVQMEWTLGAMASSFAGLPIPQYAIVVSREVSIAASPTVGRMLRTII